jgi:CRISPR system Cascade subunit CasD
MNVLLLRLAGPMQSWGVQSRFGVRDTGLEPSKSGVVGLLCAALGRSRGEPVGDLASLRMGVRVDQEGRLLSDYHTAQRVWRARGGIKPTEVSRRYYLADARFLVGLEGEDLDLLACLHHALRDPHWSLFLGRKAFVPGEPVWLSDGLRTDVGLCEAFERYPWLGRDPARCPQQVRWVIEQPGGGEVRPDQPLSFADRRFAPRRLETRYADAPPIEEARCTCHV